MSVTTPARGPLGLEDSIPIGPLASIFDPVFISMDEFGTPVYVTLIYRNILIGGEPGAGKSSLVNNFAAHAALSTDCRLCLLDGAAPPTAPPTSSWATAGPPKATPPTPSR
jgi:S-DNA-T family DNA segregation ATPase FtsK/SpoIIIE